MISPVAVRAMMYMMSGEIPNEEEVNKKYHQMLEMVDSVAQQTYYQTWMRNDPPADEMAAAALLNHAKELAIEKVMESEINVPVDSYINYPSLWEDPIEVFLRMDDDEFEMMGTNLSQLFTEDLVEDIEYETMTPEEYKEFLNETQIKLDKIMLHCWLEKQPETLFGDKEILEKTFNILWPRIQEDPSLDPRPESWRGHHYLKEHR